MTLENGHSQEQSPGMTPENAELLARFAGHLERSPLTGRSPRIYLGAIGAYLAWLEQAPADNHPLNDAVAKDCRVVPDFPARAVPDCPCQSRSRLPLPEPFQTALARAVPDCPCQSRSRLPLPEPFQTALPIAAIIAATMLAGKFI